MLNVRSFGVAFAAGKLRLQRHSFIMIYGAPFFAFSRWPLASLASAKGAI